MKRRKFLGAATAGAAVALWPSFLRQGFADTPACDEAWAARIAQVAGAFQRARAAGKPLLVFVIPADDGDKWLRGEAFGELINHGADRDLAPLASVEVVCAAMADLKKLVPTAGAGEPLWVLVDPSRVPATARQIDAALPAYPDLYDRTLSWEEREKAEDEISDKRIALLGKALRDALGAPGDRQVPALAADVRARMKDQRVPGSKWAHASGCGTSIEGETDNVMFGCGMGHVPKKSSRFLYFFTRRIY